MSVNQETFERHGCVDAQVAHALDEADGGGHLRGDTHAAVAAAVRSHDNTERSGLA